MLRVLSLVHLEQNEPSKPEKLSSIFRKAQQLDESF